MPENVDAAIRKHCIICSRNFPAYYNPLWLATADDSAAIYYHDCHTLLKAGKLEQASLYAQLTIAAMKDTLHNPLYANTIFLQAKINNCKKSIPAAINLYVRFLRWNSTDSVFSADAYASLTQIYLDRQDWNKVADYLYPWHSYSSFSDTETRSGIYNSLVHIFYASKKVNRPEGAIRITTNFFTANKDTTRLILLCNNIGNWYAQQSMYVTAIDYLKKGLPPAIDSKNFEAQKNIYIRLSLVEEKRERWQTALYYRKVYESIEDSARIRAERSEKETGQKKSYSVNLREMTYLQKGKKNLSALTFAS